MVQARNLQLQGNLLMRLRGKLNFKLGLPVKEGMITTSGLRLLRPSENSDSEIKYSAMNDRRLLDKEQYLEFEKFMPQGFSFAGKPENQTVFGYCFDYFDYFDVKRFLTKLEEETDHLLGAGEKGDIVVYSTDYPGLSEIPVHAGVYLGNNVVSSRWMNGGPVVDHPLDEFPQKGIIRCLGDDFGYGTDFYMKKD
jgi:hypothetical protein